MTIGAALLLIAAGAILRFALVTVSTHGVDLHTIGDILMVVGVVGLLLWLFVWGPWARGRRSGGLRDGDGYPPRPPRERERYPDGYPSEDDWYSDGRRSRHTPPPEDARDRR